jgi:hypothetical protein
MAKFSFDSEGLVVDWISFNLEGLIDTEMLAYRLSKHFTPHVLMDHAVNIQDLKVTGSELRLFSLEKMRLIKTQRFDWGILKFDEHIINY